jgi:hypothetical protein
MALPSSPPITLEQVYTEFGAPNGTPLSQFYQGGPWVGTGGANVNVPTAPPIGLLNLLGAASGGTTSGFIASLSANSSTTAGVAGTTISAPVICSTTGGTGAVTYEWSLVSGATGISILSPTSASTRFSAYLSFGSGLAANMVCTCTDSVGHTTKSPVLFVNIYSSKV